MSRHAARPARAHTARLLALFRNPEERLGITALVAALFILFAHSAFAAEAIDQTDIQTALHAMFDKPDVELVIDPITVDSGFAVAGWTQGDMGGRAFLRKSGATWALVLCTGDEIKSADALKASGVPAEGADRLAAAIAESEKSLDPERLKKLASFQGVMRKDGQSQ